MLALWDVSREDKFGEGVPNLECLARSTMAQSQLLTFATEGSMLKLSSQPIRLDAVGVYPNTPGMEAMLTFTSRFGDQVKMHKVAGNCILVPRGMVKADQVPKEKDYRSDGPKQLYIEPPLKARNGDQQQALDASLSYLQAGVDHLIEAPTGFGKCHLKGERVLLYSGQLRKVEDIKVGDLLMGPDSTPRRVLSLGNGKTQAYELCTPRGEALRVNEDHILSLQLTGGSKGYGEAGSKVTVSVKDYLLWSKYKKHCYKLWKPQVIHFGIGQSLTLSPYFLGLMLGDGGLTSKTPMFSTKDPELLMEIRKEAAKFGDSVVHRGGVDYAITGGGVKHRLEDMGLLPVDCSLRKVPIDYLTSSLDDRLQLIAGLIDSDGHHVNTCFDYISKSPQLAESMCRLCWSVGLAAHQTEVRKRCANNGVWGTYYRVTISGSTSRVPTRLKRKQAPARTQKKNPLLHGFKITDLGEQEYFGFQLDKDNLYLTWNYFVTHNTFLGVSIAMQLNKPTLIIVTKEDLVHSWRAMLHNAPDADKQPGMGLPASMVGHLQADVEIWQGKRFVIGMVHSLAKEGKYAPEVFRHFGLVIFDECHRLGADTFQEVCYLLPARHRLGLSATPDRSDGKDKVFHAHIGPVLVRGTTIPMSPKILRKPTGWQIPDGMPFAPGKMMAVTKMLAKNAKRNAIIVDFVVQAHTAGRTVVVMSDLVDGHLKVLFQLLVNAGISGDKIGFYIGQNTNDKNKAKAFLDNAKTKPVVLATYGMTKEGTDVPEWDTLVLASPRSDVKQAIGRVMRTMKDKKQPVVLDLIDYNSIFQAFANSRLKQYFSVKATIVNM